MHVRHCDQCFGRKLDSGYPKKPKREMPGDIDRSDSPARRYLQENIVRAGRPDRVARWAKCSISKKYGGAYVGGGAAHIKIPNTELVVFGRGRERRTNSSSRFGEGTWGVDYRGFLGKSNVWLKYTQDKKQGGEGAYATDGEPKLISKIKSLVRGE